MSVELWLALDVSTKSSAISWVKRLKDNIDVFKIGLELFTAEGPSIVSDIKNLGCKVFLDIKLHDIPNTVAGAVRNATKLGADYIDVHASGGPEMMRVAVETASEESIKLGRKNRPKILAITVLTSLNEASLIQLNIDSTPLKLVKEWAKLAQSCGLDGVVNSIKEVQEVRKVCGKQFFSVTPGIRPTDVSKTDDQKRVGTPRDAAELGSSAIVVGRPILQSKDPVKIAYQIKNDLELERNSKV